MWQDAYLRFSNAQAVTADAASTNSLDLRAIRNMGVGEKQLFVVVQVTTAMADTGSNSTCAVTIETSSDDSSYTAAVQTLGTFAATSAVGTRITCPIAHGAMNTRYVRLKYTMANGDLSAGAFSAVITADPQAWTAYADDVTYTT